MADTETAATDDKSLLEEARANYKIAQDWWKHNQTKWLAAAKFRALDQWDAEIKKKREAEGNPCLVFDKLNQYVRQVVNDGRQNRPGIKIRPIDDKGDIDVAEGLQGLVRSIFNASNGDDALDTALDHAAGNGFGFIRVLTEFEHDLTFEQKICIKRVRNPISVLLGPHEMADGSDAEFGFVEVDEPKARFKKKYPKAKQTNWGDDAYSEWSDENNVRVCEYFYKVDEPGLLHQLVDGTTATDEDYQNAIKNGAPNVPAIAQVDGVPQTREVSLCKVKWCRLTGAEILEKKKFPSKYIPIIPVYGNESDIEGKVTYTGLIEAAKDAQILHNFSRSAFAQRVALTPKAPWLIAADATDDFLEWQTANGNHAALRFKAFDDQGNSYPVPRRVDPTDVPSGFAQDMQMSEHDIQAALGMYNASIGEKSNEKSGKAILARQREGDNATFHYQDNLNRAIRHLGRIVVDMAPKVYDSTRLVRLLGDDGVTSEARLDPRQDVAHMKVKENGKELSVFNLNIGTYDADIDAGPSYTTKRAESAEAMIQLTQANPTMWQTHGDLIVAAQDWPNAQEFAKRSKLLLPPQVAQAEDNGGNPEADAIKQQAQQMIDQLQQQLQQASQMVGDLQKKADDQQAKQENDSAKVQVEAYKAETERMVALAPAMTPESVVQIVQQVVQTIMAQPVPTEAPSESLEPPEPMPDMDEGMMGGGMMPPDPGAMGMPMNQQPPDGGFFYA